MTTSNILISNGQYLRGVMVFEEVDKNTIIIDGVTYKRQETEKPKKLLEIIETWIKNTDHGSKWDDLVDVIGKQWIPKELKTIKYDNYAHGWNDCLNRLKLTLK